METARKKLNTGTVVEVAVNSVDLPTDGGIRQYYNETTLDELGKSISDHGALYPIIVSSKAQGRYELVVGSRRLRIAKKLGFEKIQAVVLSSIDDQQRLEIALAENLHREDLTPFEEARVILKLINDYKTSLKDVAKKIGRSEIFVRQRLQLLSLPRQIQKMVAERKISLSHVSVLATLSSPEEQIRIAQEAAENDLAGDELTTLIQERRKEELTARRGRKPKSAGVAEKKTSPKPEPVKPKKIGWKKFTAERVSLKVLGFVRWLEAVQPEMAKLSLLEQIATQKAIHELIAISNKFLPKK